jgi:hypothetical protein
MPLRVSNNSIFLQVAGIFDGATAGKLNGVCRNPGRLAAKLDCRRRTFGQELAGSATVRRSPPDFPVVERADDQISGKHDNKHGHAQKDQSHGAAAYDPPSLGFHNIVGIG